MPSLGAACGGGKHLLKREREKKKPSLMCNCTPSFFSSQFNVNVRRRTTTGRWEEWGRLKSARIPSIANQGRRQRLRRCLKRDQTNGESFSSIFNPPLRIPPPPNSQIGILMFPLSAEGDAGAHVKLRLLTGVYLPALIKLTAGKIKGSL